MEGRVEFDINAALKNYLDDPATIPTPGADGALQDCESDPESLTAVLVNSVLNPIVEAIAESPEALNRSATFDSLQFLLKCAPISLTPEQRFPLELYSELFNLSRFGSIVPSNAISKLMDTIVSGLATEAEIAHNDMETDEQEVIQPHKQLLEMYGFLLQWSIAVAEAKAAEKPTNAAPARGRGAKGAKSKTSTKDAEWDSTAQLQPALDVMSKVLKLKLSKIFVTTSERDTFVQLFTRAVYLVFESEARTKSTTIRMHAIKVLCIAVKHHGHAFGK